MMCCVCIDVNVENGFGQMCQGVGVLITSCAFFSEAHIPYRNSKLTYLLSESLMGNCKTVMVACASPAAASFAMTESTIRFASSVKKIKTKPVKNEELEGQLVDSLRAEIDSLRRQLEGGSSNRKSLTERLQATQLLEQKLGETWEEQLQQSKAFETERGEMLNRLGLTTANIASAWMRGEMRGETVQVRGDADPYLVNICDDPLLSGCLTYTLPPREEVLMNNIFRRDVICIQVSGIEGAET